MATMEKCEMAELTALDAPLDECDAHMLRAAGVYAVINEDEEVVYIGQTDCFIKRWGEHCSNGKWRCPRKEIFKFLVLEYEENRERRFELEAAYIQKYIPKYNLNAGNRHWLRPRSYVNPYKVRELRKRGLYTKKYDPFPPLEEPEAALENELKFLDIDNPERQDT